MDLATIIGVLLAFGALFGMVEMEHVELEGLFIPAPMVLVFGATLACGIAGTTLKGAIANLKMIPKAFTAKVAPPQAVIDDVVGLAETARSNGLLALEQEADKHDDPFLKKALQNIADGTDGEDLRVLLEDEIESNVSSTRNASKFFMGLGGYAPTVGIIGTVVSLTHVLANLSKPDELGPLIASAFVATLWGLLSANFLWLPIGGKLKTLADLETSRQTLLMEGLLAVQAGSQPRLLGERLKAMVPPEHRGDAGGKGAKGGAKGGGKGADADEQLAA